MYKKKCREGSCNSSHWQLTINGASPLLFCGGRAGKPRGVVFRPVRLQDNGQTEGCEMIVNGSALFDKQPLPMNCETNKPRM